MAAIVPIYYAPDLDNAWSVAPGALTDIAAYVPLQSGNYGSIGTGNYFSASLTGNDFVSSYMLRQIGGSVRFFVNRNTNIDEYDSAGTRTNRGTGYVSTANWSMCAQGNAIIACSIDNTTQVSTGAGFAALGGGSPKAAHCASNFGFVMLANTDTSADQVWWSALYNYASFTPSIATEAGNQRLLEAPGPITALIAYRDGFVAFKDNALFIGEYTGPNYIWRWRCLSHRIGCVGAQAVTELDGKLFFLHTSGFYSFDGQTITNVGLAVNQTFLSAISYVSGTVGGSTSLGVSGDAISLVRSAADDIEGVVWFQTNRGTTVPSTGKALLYGYNARSNKWGRHIVTVSDGTVTNSNCLVRASTADAQSFNADTAERVLMVWSIQGSASKVRSIRYPYATTDSAQSSVTTGVIGSTDSSATLTKVNWRTLYGTDADATPTISASGYTSENKLVTNGTATGSYNAEFDNADILISSRFRSVTYTGTIGTKKILAGIGIDVVPGGKR